MSSLSERLQEAAAALEAGSVRLARQTADALTAEYPDHAEAHYLLARACAAEGNSERALQEFEEAVKHDQQNAEYVASLAAMREWNNEPQLAAELYRRAIELTPRQWNAHFGLMRSWETLGAPEQKLAEAATKLGALQPPVELCEEIGCMFQSRDRPIAAQAWLSLAVAGSGQEAPLAWVLSLADRFIENRFFREANALLDTYADRFSHEAAFHEQRSRVCEALEDASGAAKAIARAIELDSRNMAYRLREIAICPAVFESSAELDAYRTSLRKRLTHLLKHELPVTKSELLQSGFQSPFYLAFQGRDDRELKEMFAAVCRPALAGPAPSLLKRRERRTIGFVVTRGHEGVFLRCMREVILRLDRARFEVVIACHRSALERMHREFAAKPVRYATIGENLAAAIAAVTAAECDVLYYWEIGSDMLNYALPFAHAAPMQCTSWSTQSTTGMQEVDYYLSSRYVEDASAQSQYTERLVLLDSLLTFQQRVQSTAAPDRGRLGLPDSKPIYLCAQAIGKYHPDQDDLFREILERDRSGSLVVKGGKHSASSEQVERRLRKHLGPHAERLMVLPWLSANDYQTLLQSVDVVLDPIHFSAGSSAYDLFSWNLPNVTLPGKRFVSRYTAACYKRIGLSELIAADRSDYVAKAVHWANDRTLQREVRERIAASSDGLFECPAAVSEYERFFAELEIEDD